MIKSRLMAIQTKNIRLEDIDAIQMHEFIPMDVGTDYEGLTAAEYLEPVIFPKDWTDARFCLMKAEFMLKKKKLSKQSEKSTLQLLYIDNLTQCPLEHLAIDAYTALSSRYEGIFFQTLHNIVSGHIQIIDNSVLMVPEIETRENFQITRTAGKMLQDYLIRKGIGHIILC